MGRGHDNTCNGRWHDDWRVSSGSVGEYYCIVAIQMWWCLGEQSEYTVLNIASHMKYNTWSTASTAIVAAILFQNSVICSRKPLLGLQRDIHMRSKPDPQFTLLHVCIKLPDGRPLEASAAIWVCDSSGLAIGMAI